MVGAQATAAGHHAKSGKDGVATFASVPRTTVQVSVRASGHGPGAAAVKIGKSQASAEATVRLPAGGDLVVRVRGVTRASRALGTRATAVQLGNGSGLTSRSVRLDAHGRARLVGLAAGTWLVGVTNLQQPPPLPVKVTVPGAHPVALKMPRAHPITGRVLDADGHPVAGVWVYATRQDGGVPDSAMALSDVPSAETDAHGRFRLAQAGVGHYRLVAKRGQTQTPGKVARAGAHHVVLRFGRS